VTLVFHFDRVEHCHPKLVAFFAWWGAHGPWPITIPASGGIRSDSLEQARLFAEGFTKARLLIDTPHGRGCAADAYPAILDPTSRFVAGVRNDAKDPRAAKMFAQYGALAETHGLTWGGRWTFQDLPHVEVPGWRDTPYPP
jgi:hypothetical protein